MDVKIKKSTVKGSVRAVPSKSVAHRLMIAAALSGRTLSVENGGKDIRATFLCLQKIAPHINASIKGEIALNAFESGSTLRFLLPLVCALGIECTIDGEGRLKDRPLGGLIETLEEHGAKIEKNSSSCLPLRVSGKLSAGEYRIDGSVSSQYVTGLLFALPLLDGDSKIIIEGEVVSSNYIDITLGVLADFCINIKRTEDGFFAKGNQEYVCPQSLEVEGDWSSAGFMLALGVLAGEVCISGLNQNSLQGDKVVTDLLLQAGADISFNEFGVIAKKSDLRAIEFDAKNCPDAVPIMATVLSFAKGTSKIRHVDRLRDKESDRLSAIRDMLADFGVRTEYADDELIFYGSEHRPCVTHGFNDHRMAMSAMVCAISTDGISTVRGVECINKSYPSFIEHIEALGANVKILE